MKHKWLIIIAILAALIRFISLSDLPPALNRDEAAIGYNAYSILTTARDEHGQYLPLSFKSIGDYKMPLYIYATVIPVKLFGLNDFSIRFWSALAGVVSVIAVYYLTKELIKKPQAALLASALMALNPWAIFYSRIGFEANLALAFFLVGLCLINRGLKKLSYFISGLLVFLLALLTYSSSLVFIPLFLIVFFLINLKQLKRYHLFFITLFTAAVAFFVILLMPISSQKSQITIFSDPTTLDYYNHTRTKMINKSPILARTWWNKYVFFTRRISSNYLKTFSPNFLAFQGSNHPWHQIPNMGYFYVLTLIFTPIGLYYLLKSKNFKLKLLLLSWFFLAPIPSAITIDAPHATRSLHLLPIILILASLGFSNSFKFIKSKKYLLPLIIIIQLISLGYFFYQYLINYPQAVSQGLPVGLKPSIQYLKDNHLQGNIYLTNIHASTYLYPLVYSQFDPSIFQQQALWTQPDTAGLINAYQFGQFTIVDDLRDIKDPAAIILPKDQDYSGQPSFTSANYQVYLTD